MKNIETIDALGLITKLILEKIDKKIPIAVNHVILLKKLKRCGIRDHASKLLASYLQGRKKREKMNGQTSEAKTVETGILGSSLFILYINDLLLLLRGKIFSHADDTAVIESGNTWQQVQHLMNNDLSKISDWLPVNRLFLNIKKTVYLNFGSYYNSFPYNLQIQINNSPIEQQICSKYLGVIFYSNLKWDLHIKYILEK